MHHKISAALFHSGAKHENVVRLNSLGVCVSKINGLHTQQVYLLL